MASGLFVNQMAVADVVIATKADLASAEHLAAFQQYMDGLMPAKQSVVSIVGGAMDWRLLTYPHMANGQLVATERHPVPSETALNEEHPAPDAEGVVRIENRAEFGVSCGWLFGKDWQFEGDQLLALFQRLEVPRIKGVFATSEGWMTINKMRETISSEIIDETEDSRVEMVALEDTQWLEIDRQLRACRKQ